MLKRAAHHQSVFVIYITNYNPYEMKAKRSIDNNNKIVQAAKV